MKNLPLLKCFAMDYHLRFSHSANTVLQKPLKEYLKINFIAWDGQNLTSKYINSCSLQPLIFFQLPPPPKILSNSKNRIIWIPMWDQMYSYPLAFWQSLPKNIRIVAFSDTVADITEKVGLPTLRLKFYFRNRNRVNRKNGNVMYYWNRTGLFDKKFIEKISKSLNINKIIFQSQIDPGIPRKYSYNLPQYLGNAKVESINSYLPQSQYLILNSQANIYLAPRIREGIGLSFLQALSGGCPVFAYNAPVMNEYIRHKQNGYLFKLTSPFSRLIKRITGSEKSFYYSSDFTFKQNWKEIENLDLKKMGLSAFSKNLEGYKKWVCQIPEFADFILNWN